MSNLYIGTKRPAAIYIGGSKVNSVYLGTEKIWSSGRLPAAYQECEWIGSSGTQYIDTGVVAAYGDTIDAVFTPTVRAHGKHFFGSRNGNYYVRLYIHSDTWYIYGGAGHMAAQTIICTVGTEYTAKLILQSGANQVTVNTKTVTSAGTGTLPNYNCYLFGQNNAGTFANGSSIQSSAFSITRDGSKLVDLVPCYRKIDGVIGMYDLVSKTFKTNLGTGTFTKGADVIL